MSMKEKIAAKKKLVESQVEPKKMSMAEKIAAREEEKKEKELVYTQVVHKKMSMKDKIAAKNKLAESQVEPKKKSI